MKPQCSKCARARQGCKLKETIDSLVLKGISVKVSNICTAFKPMKEDIIAKEATA